MKIAAREDKQARNVRPLHHNVGEDLSCDIYHTFFYNNSRGCKSLKEKNGLEMGGNVLSCRTFEVF